MGYFDAKDFSSAEVRRNRRYFISGSYVVELMTMFMAGKQSSGYTWVTEWKVLESTNPSLPAGTQGVSHSSPMHWKTANATIRSCLAALLDVPYDDITPEMAESAVAVKTDEKGEPIEDEYGRSVPVDKLAGLRCRVWVDERKTEKIESGKIVSSTFTDHTYSPYKT